MPDTDKETIDALVKSVHDMDSSRRVGWAKHFEDEIKLADLQREVESLRFQRDLFRRVASYMDGYLKKQSEIIGCGTTPSTLTRYMSGMAEYLEDHGFREGQSDARKSMEDWSGITDVQIKREALRRENRANRRAEQRDSRAVLERLARQYRFPNVSSMRAFLKMHRDHVEKSGRR